MDVNSPYQSWGTSWADQWDSGQDPAPAAGKSKKGAGLEKTKKAATAGVKRVKEGTGQGLQWIKDKFSSHKKSKEKQYNGVSKTSKSFPHSLAYFSHTFNWPEELNPKVVSPSFHKRGPQSQFYALDP
ncbi:hypothetical protein Taro_010644 [Colocasia esculenta]|uniref:Uncharacterized protein n=1 Tax=Colocasia esculenta TaxID=4460 RepID=A0A843U3U8_COLES|nr:hypothetical protein [Colocasia esculenta]